MPAEPGTFERIALLLGDALAPLAERLEPSRAEETLAQFGLQIPSSVMTPALRSALGAAASAAGELPALISSLSASISADAGGISITGDAVKLAEKVGRLIDAMVTIGDQIGSLSGVPGATGAELSAFASALPGRLLELVLVDNLMRRQPTFSALLSLIGVIEETHLNPGSMDPAKPETVISRLRFDRYRRFLHIARAVGGAICTAGDILVSMRRCWSIASADAAERRRPAGDARFTIPGRRPRRRSSSSSPLSSGTPAGVRSARSGHHADAADRRGILLRAADRARARIWHQRQRQRDGGYAGVACSHPHR